MIINDFALSLKTQEQLILSYHYSMYRSSIPQNDETLIILIDR
jgi:hypothetical protein